MRRFIITIFLIAIYGQSVASIQDTKRYALVIGNKSYVSAPLKNAGNDANAIADSLTELGFRVNLLEDGNFVELNSEVTKFYTEVQKDKHPRKLAIIYYAGHALQINHQNYIVPIDLQFESHQAFMAGLYKIDNLFTEINKIHNLQSIIILDACRTNPFENNSVIDNGNMSKGLAPIKAPANTLIAFATEPGGVAADGNRKNGIYTQHLLRHINKQISVEEVFKKVRQGVSKQTRNKQIPWEHSSLLGETFFSPPKNRDLPNFTVF
jgi:uncharacterized caspase-like protein